MSNSNNKNLTFDLKHYTTENLSEVSKEQFYYSVDIFNQDLHIKVLDNKYIWEFKHPITEKLIALAIQYNKEVVKHYFINQ